MPRKESMNPTKALTQRRRTLIIYFDPETYLSPKTHDVSEEIEQLLDKSFKKGLKKSIRKGIAENFPQLTLQTI